jgi:hypothetical protein
MSADVRVDCIPDALGWLCTAETGSTQHRVIVTQADLDELAPGVTDPTKLVSESFAFLLEREPPSAILREFGLADIERYFPDYRAVIRDRLAR